MYMEAIAPLAALLEKTDDENFTIKEAIPMVQSAIWLLGDAMQHHSSLRRKAIMQHLNPQLQTLMKDADFKGSQPLLFGEEWGEGQRKNGSSCSTEEGCGLTWTQRETDMFSEKPPSEKHMGSPGWQEKALRPHLQAKEGARSKDFPRKVLTRHLKCINSSCVN